MSTPDKRISIVREDDTMIVDGMAATFDLVGSGLDSGIWAVQWDHTSGQVEYNNHTPPNETIEDFAPYDPLLTEFDAVVRTPDRILLLGGNRVDEGQPIGTVVSGLDVSAQVEDDPITYTLVSGEGSEDNSSFSIDGTNLKTAAIFDYETKNTYSIRMRATNNSGRWYEQVISIQVNDVAE